jgi:hypothetical protein
MPGGAAGKLHTLQQHHIANTALCQVIGDGASDNATANNNDPGPGWEFSFISHIGLFFEI